jgi:hypothetical protein
MVGFRRLVGWGLVSAFTVPWALPAHAQSTASFPEDPPKSSAPKTSAPKASPPPARTPPPPPRPLPPSPYSSSRAATPKRTPPRARKPAPVTIPATPERGLEPSPYPGDQAPPNIVITKRPRFDNNPYATPEGPPVSGSSPPILPYRTGMPVPAGYEVVTRPNSGLITGGAVGLGLTYGVALIVGATEGFENGTGWLAAPLIGPWGAIGARKYECKSATQTVSEAKKCVRAAVGEVQIITVIAVDGIAQLATAVIMLAGALSSHDELVRQDLVNVAVIPPSDKREPWQLSLSGNF